MATPAGTTKSAEAHDLVPQGSGGAARASGLDIALGLKKQFSGSTDKVWYGWVRCNPQAFQDNIARLAEGIDSMNAGNVKIFEMLTLKGLECHPDKTTFINIDTKQYKKRVEKETCSFCKLLL